MNGGKHGDKLIQKGSDEKKRRESKSVNHCIIFRLQLNLKVKDAEMVGFLSFIQFPAE